MTHREAAAAVRRWWPWRRRPRVPKHLLPIVTRLAAVEQASADAWAARAIGQVASAQVLARLPDVPGQAVTAARVREALAVLAVAEDAHYWRVATGRMDDVDGRFERTEADREMRLAAAVKRRPGPGQARL
jgi:hypothetical protein